LSEGEYIVKEETKKVVYSLFSEKLMILLAVLAIPAIVAEFYFKMGSIEFEVALAADWFIWFMFLLEFLLKVIVEGKFNYIKQNKLDSTISAVIIVSPIVGLIAPVYTSIPVIRLVRISKLFKATSAVKVTETVKVARVAAYTGNAAVKKDKQISHEGTFTISRIELKHILTALGVGEKDIGTLLAALDKTHRHTNIIVFASLLEKLGVNREKMSNVFRRMGMDDVTITNIFRMTDESKISAETGRIYDAVIDFS
jgi:hypothetical protein